MGTDTAKSQWLSYSGQTTDEWSGGIATFITVLLVGAWRFSRFKRLGVLWWLLGV